MSIYEIKKGRLIDPDRSSLIEREEFMSCRHEQFRSATLVIGTLGETLQHPLARLSSRAIRGDFSSLYEIFNEPLSNYLQHYIEQGGCRIGRKSTS
jgi:hypothetical protein